MTVKAVVFDLDGTLVDTMQGYAEKAAALISEVYGKDRAWARRRYMETSGLPFVQQLEILFPGNPANCAVAQRFEEWKATFLPAHSSLRTEVAGLLRRLRTRGIAVVVSSNNLARYVREITAKWPVDVALGFDAERGLCKGEPHFRWIESRLSVSREEMVFIGDSPNDARIAHEAKVRFIAVLTGPFRRSEFQTQNPECVFVDDTPKLEEALKNSIFQSFPPAEDGRGTAARRAGCGCRGLGSDASAGRRAAPPAGTAPMGRDWP